MMMIVMSVSTSQISDKPNYDQFCFVHTSSFVSNLSFRERTSVFPSLDDLANSHAGTFVTPHLLLICIVRLVLLELSTGS